LPGLERKKGNQTAAGKNRRTRVTASTERTEKQRAGKKHDPAGGLDPRHFRGLSHLLAEKDRGEIKGCRPRITGQKGRNLRKHGGAQKKKVVLRGTKGCQTKGIFWWEPGKEKTEDDRQRPKKGPHWERKVPRGAGVRPGPGE